jgi:zinc protease
MKKLFVIFSFSWLLITVLIIPYTLAGQDLPVTEKNKNTPLDELLPDDPLLKKGEIKNGLEYFIYKNSKPANSVELRLVVRAGSVLEDNDQRGAAHFVEHMAFNGTRHFPKKRITEFIESLGMKFGPDLNASTGFDETIYKLALPAGNRETLETAFKIMADWSHGITFDPDEIEQERSVIIEEWRTCENAAARATKTHMQSLLKGSRYTERWPIGTLESIQNLNKEKLLRFYRDWYRPDLMAVIAVGDFDTELIEQLIKKYFSHIPMPDNPRKVITCSVLDHVKRRLSISAEPEVSFSTVKIYKKIDSKNVVTIRDFRRVIVENLFHGLFADRLYEINRENNAPFLYAVSSKEQLTPLTDAHVLNANILSVAEVDRALKVLLEESERINRFGFTESELQRRKSKYLAIVETYFANRKNIKSGSITSNYVDAFLNQKTIPGIEYKTMLYRQIIPDISLKEINELGRMLKCDENCVVTVTALKKEGLTVPDEKKLAAVFDEVADMKIEPYVDVFKDIPLVKEPPTGAKIISSIDKEGGITEWKLANGVQVVLKPTDFDTDDVVFRGFSPGGTSLVFDKDLIFAEKADVLIGKSGIGDFNENELAKKTYGSGIISNVDPFIDRYEEGLWGNGWMKNLETLFQMIYLRFTAPRADKDVFEKYHTLWKQALISQENLPIFRFNKAFNRIVTQDHPRRRPPTVEDLEKMDLQQSLKIYRERFGDASDFTFIFVGAFDLNKMRPLVERYLGGLPSINRQDGWKDHGMRYPGGVVNETVTAGTDPRSQTRIAFYGYLGKEEQPQEPLLETLAQLFGNRLRDVLREELGGVYGVSVSSTIIWQPLRAYFLNIIFVSDPDREKELVARVFKEIEYFKNSAFSEEKVAGIRKAMLSNYEKDVKGNRFWLSELRDSYRYDKNPGAEKILNYPNIVKDITPQKVKEAMRRYFNTNKYIHITLMPEK